MQYSKHITLTIFISIFILIFIYGGVLSSKITYHGNDMFTIDRNSSLNQVAKLLEKEISLNSDIFKIAMYITFNQDNIKYGRYNLSHANNLRDLIHIITSSESDRVKVTIVEGWKIQYIALYLEIKLGFDVEKFIYLCYDKKLIKSLGLEGDINNLEGFLFPDTYMLLKSFTEKDVIEILLSQYKRNYKSVTPMKTILNEYETIVMASIIQAESKYKADMDTISSVFYNRLNDKINYGKLQADPTIQYIIPGPNIRLFNKHLKIVSPYNTYINDGLPPGPINSPGLDAINAALFPLETEYYYFVADGKGKHIFNIDNSGHNNSKNNVSR